MTYFVMAYKRDGILENVRIGGYKTQGKAFNRFRRYATASVIIYTSNGLKTIATRSKGKETML